MYSYKPAITFFYKVISQLPKLYLHILTKQEINKIKNKQEFNILFYSYVIQFKMQIHHIFLI